MEPLITEEQAREHVRAHAPPTGQSRALPPAVARIPDSRQPRSKGCLSFSNVYQQITARVIHVRPQPLKTTSAKTPTMRTKITIQCRHHYLSKTWINSWKFIDRTVSRSISSATSCGMPLLSKKWICQYQPQSTIAWSWFQQGVTEA